MLTLLPLSLDELQQSNILPESLEFLLIKGCYPRIYDQPIPAKIWYSNYITTYVEKDVRKIINIADLNAFQRFLKLCAARVGNLLNYASLARDCDVSPNTVKAWISLLEASYIIFLMYPYSKNFNKRIIKAPKLYFYDSGLVCSLLNIRSTEELSLSAIRGALFESYIISEIYKYNYHRAERPALYFWRDVQGHEIDCIIEQSIDVLIPIEIKAQKTMNDSFFKGLVDWNTITGYADGSSYVIYTGDEVVHRKKGYVYRWEKLIPLLHTIYKR